MAITHFGNKMLRGTKVDRKVDSLGSSADGTNTGITLLGANETLKSTPDYTEVFASDLPTGWDDDFNSGYDGNFRGNYDGSSTTNALWVDFNDGTSYNIRGWIDLNSSKSIDVSDTKWTLRYTLNVNTFGSGGQIIMGMSTNDDKYNESQRFLGVRIKDGDDIRLMSTDDRSDLATGNDTPSAGYNSISTGTDYFVEIYRNSSTLGLKIRTGSHSGTLVHNVSQTIDDSGADHVAMDFIKFMNKNSGGSGEGIRAVFKDLKFYNNSIDFDGSKLGSGAYKLDNTSEGRIEVGSASDWQFLHNTTAKFTIATWFKRPTAFTNMSGSSLSGDLTWLCETTDGNDSGIGIKYDNRNDPDHRFQCEIVNESNSAVCVIQEDNWFPDDDNWHHLALTYDATLSSTNMIAYLDGVQKGTANKTGTPSDVDSGDTLRIGGGVDSHARVGNWTLDDFGIWNRVLTATEIGKLANNNESASAGWTLNNSAIADGKITCTGSGESYKSFTGLGKPTDFTLDFDFTRNSGDGGDTSAILLASDNGGYGDPSSGHIRLHFYIANGNSTQLSFRMNSGSGNVETNFSLTGGAQSTGTTKYYRIVKDDATITCYKYPTANDRTNGTNLDTSANGTVNTTTYNAVSNDFQYFIVDGHGSATKNFAVDNVKYYKDKTSPSGTPEINETFTQGDAQLVSSLSNKAGLKAHYSMDTTPAAASLDDDFSSYANQTSADNVWKSSDTAKCRVNITDNDIDFDSVEDDSNDSISYDLGSTLSNTEWIARFKFNISTADNSGLAPGTDRHAVVIGLFDVDETVGFHSSTSKSGVYLDLHLDRDGTDRTYFAKQSDVTSSFDGAGQTGWSGFSTGTDYYCEIKRTSDANATMTIRTGSHTGSTALGTPRDLTSLSGLNGLRYFGIKCSQWGYGGRLTGTIDDVQVWDATTTPSDSKCPNDASSTSELDGMTNLPTNTIFLQTDDTPSYWWKQSDNTWKISGIPAADGWWDMSASDTTTSSVTDKSGNGHTLVQSTSNKRPSVVSSAQNGLNALSFNVNDDFMITTDNMTCTPQQTVFCVFKVTKETANGWQYYLTDGGTAHNAINQYGDNWRLSTGNNDDLSETSWDRWLVLTVQFNGSSSFLRDNGSQTSFNSTLESGNGTGFTLNGYAGKAGAGDSGSYGGNTDWGECIVYNSILSSSEIYVVEQYLKDKWGTP